MLYLIFGYFALSIIGITLMALSRRNPIHAVLWLLLLFMHIAVLYLFLNAEFLAAVQIIVYAGAILVMFLFTVFLLGVREMPREERFTNLWQGRVAVGLAMMAVLALTLSKIMPTWKGQYSIEYIERVGHTKAVGSVLFNEFAFPFFLIGVILLIPMVAVVAIAWRGRS